MEPKKPSDPDFLGKWKITSRLGEGGFGIVYLASSGVQSVAIKVIKEEFLEDPGAREKIIFEAQVLGKLEDPNIGRIIDSGLDEHLPWLATEYINGPTLQEKVQLESPLEEVAWFNLASNLFHALVTSHAAGVIHKDIKPSNIILGESGTKLIDFGIAHATGSTKTAAFGDFEGSHPYSAPESYTGKNNPKMDVFSGAATLAFAAHGNRVWNGDNALQLMRSINEAEPNLEGLSDAQRNFLLPLFAKDATDRPSAEEAYRSSLEFLESVIKGGATIRATRTKNLEFRSRKGRRTVLVLGIVTLGVAMASASMLSNSHNSVINKQPVLSTTQTPGSKLTAIPISPLPTSPNSTTTPSSIAILNNQNNSPSGSKQEIQLASDQCVRLTQRLNIDQAIPLCLKAAKGNDAVAMFELGYIYSVQKSDNKTAMVWYLKSATAGYPVAMFNLGVIYVNQKDDLNAKKWFSKCINSQYALCAYNLGATLEKEGNLEEAKIAYQRGVLLKDADSARNLGLIFTKEANWTQARDAFKVGAALGDYLSQYSLGKVLMLNFADVAGGCEWINKSRSLNPNYEDARIVFQDTCRNLSWSVSADASYSALTSAPYVSTIPEDKGGWVIWTKVKNESATGFTGLQYRVTGTNNKWQFLYYKSYANDYGDSVVAPPPQDFSTDCLDFRLVKDNAAGVISQVWTFPTSTCKNKA